MGSPFCPAQLQVLSCSSLGLNRDCERQQERFVFVHSFCQLCVYAPVLLAPAAKRAVLGLRAGVGALPGCSQAVQPGFLATPDRPAQEC